ncbi:MAG: hypothetical protein QOG10_6354 [Kribbellaceae bacterium]|nr:hypothetical protein [Kribbellaceae bacterium]
MSRSTWRCLLPDLLTGGVDCGRQAGTREPGSTLSEGSQAGGMDPDERVISNFESRGRGVPSACPNENLPTGSTGHSRGAPVEPTLSDLPLSRAGAPQPPLQGSTKTHRPATTRHIAVPCDVAGASMEQVVGPVGLDRGRVRMAVGFRRPVREIVPPRA